MEPDKKQEVLILSMLGGFGHIRAGEALLDYAKENLPHVHATHVDISDINTSLKEYAKIYDILVKRAPIVWKVLYSYLPASLVKKTVKLEGLISSDVKDYVLKKQPDVIIFTNVTILPMLVAPLRKSLPAVKMAVTVTDYHGHPYYIFPELDRYFVPHEKVKEELEQLGAPQDKIVVSGIPVNPRFYIKQDAGELRKKYGINNDFPVVLLITSFKITREKLLKAVRQLLEFEPKINLICITNGNETFYDLLQKSFGGQERFSLVNWSNTIEEYIKMSSVVISKAGGLTVSECMAVRTPILMVSPIPGQEDYNAEFVEKNNFGKRADDIDEIPTVLPGLISMSEKTHTSLIKNPCKEIFNHLL